MRAAAAEGVTVADQVHPLRPSRRLTVTLSRSVLVAALVASVLAVVSAPAHATTGPSVRVVHALELVRPGDLPTSFATAAPSASLRAIRNEFESFQIVVHGGDAGVTGLQVAVSSPLTGPGGTTIPAADVRIYAERYYTVTTPSDRELFPDADVVSVGANVRCPEGSLRCQFPDALVPERDVFYDEDRNAFPLDIPANQNRVAFVDVFVPQDALVGTFTGSIQVTGGGVNETVPVSLQVLDFGGAAMPSTPTLRGGVQVSTGAFCPAHAGCTGTAADNQALYDRYVRSSIENRFPLTRPMLAGPDNDAAWTTYGSKATTGATAARLPGGKVTDVLFTNYAGNNNYDALFAVDWKQRQASINRTDLVSYYCDEMGTIAVNWDTICESGYDVARGVWNSTSVVPDPGALSVTNTGSAASLAFGRARPGHDAADNVDNLVVVNTNIDNPGANGGTNMRPSYGPPGGFLGEAADHQLWMYTSCMSAGCAPQSDLTTVNAPNPLWNQTPGMLIDQPPSETRSIGWNAFRYDLTGDFYYQAVEKLSSAWSPCAYPPSNCQFFEGANGDGTLFYPGTPAQIGGTTHIPIESLRLKRERDGREDYEILHWLSTHGKDTEARAIATALFPNLYSTDQSASALAAARDQLLDLLTPTVPAGSGAGYHAVVPSRILDSRTATGAWSGPLVEGAPRDLTVSGPGGPGGSGGASDVPATATAVVMNVTATQGTAGSFLTVYPSDSAPPNASNLNFGVGETVPNLVTVKLASGKARFANAVGAVDVVADVVGYYDDGEGPGDRYNGIAPTRLLDSRTSTGGWSGPLVAGAPRLLGVRQPINSAGAPASASAVIVNVTATEATTNSFLTIGPSDAPAPNVSNLNFGAGETIPNLAIVKVAANGTIRLANAAGAVNVVVDLVGYFDPSSGDLFHAIAPTRVLDDRVGTGFIGPWSPGQQRSLAVAGVEGTKVPVQATGLVVNVTATAATAGSFVTVFPTGQNRPSSSNLNFGPGQTRPNLVVTKIGTAGRIDIWNALGGVDLVADAVGYYAPT